MKNLAVILPLLAVACGGGFTGTVTQKVNLKQGDISGTSIAAEKDFDSEGSAWNTFLKDAKAELGADPEVVEVVGVKVTLDVADSKNAGKFEEAIKGAVVVYAKDKETNRTIDLATVENPTGNGTVVLEAKDVDLAVESAKLGAGKFKLGLKGDAVKTTEDDFDLKTTIILELEAK